MFVCLFVCLWAFESVYNTCIVCECRNDNVGDMFTFSRVCRFKTIVAKLTIPKTLTITITDNKNNCKNNNDNDIKR